MLYICISFNQNRFFMTYSKFVVFEDKLIQKVAFLIGMSESFSQMELHSHRSKIDDILAQYKTESDTLTPAKLADLVANVLWCDTTIDNQA